MDVAFSSDMQINGLFPGEADAVDLQNKSENALVHASYVNQITRVPDVACAAIVCAALQVRWTPLLILGPVERKSNETH